MFFTYLPSGTPEGCYAIGNGPRVSKNITMLVNKGTGQSYEKETERSYPLSFSVADTDVQQLQQHNGYFFFLVFLGPRPQHMEVSRLGVELELELPAYATATATPDLSCV